MARQQTQRKRTWKEVQRGLMNFGKNSKNGQVTEFPNRSLPPAEYQTAFRDSHFDARKTAVEGHCTCAH